MQFSQRPKTFPRFFIAFVKSTSSFKYFENKDESHCLSISEFSDSERVREPFGSQRVNGS